MPPHADNSTLDLRGRIAQLRADLEQVTVAYRTAVARHDSAKTVTLLRTRSQMMRQLLEAQCQLLLRLRSGDPVTPPEPAEAPVLTAEPAVAV